MPTTPNLSKTALILIDYQIGLCNPTSPTYSITHNPSLTKSVSTLLAAFRATNAHILHVQHHSTNPSSSLHPSKPTSQICSFATPLPNEPLFTKSVNSAFIGTELETWLREHDVRRLLFMGVTTDHCVSTSVRMAENLQVVPTRGEGGDGEILLVGDACATFAKGGWDAKTVHEVGLASLDGEFGRVVGTEEVVGEMAGWA